MKYEYWRSTKDQRWYWQLKTDEGERIAYGESHGSKEACLKSMAACKASAKAEEIDISLNDNAQQSLFKTSSLSHRRPD